MCSPCANGFRKEGEGEFAMWCFRSAVYEVGECVNSDSAAPRRESVLQAATSAATTGACRQKPPCPCTSRATSRAALAI
jgi:hypothetical protein